MDVTLVVVIAIFVIAIFAVILFYLMMRKQSKAMQKRKDLKHKFFSNNHNGTLDGIKFKHQFRQGGRYETPFYKISIKTKSNGSFKVIKENFFDRLFKKIGFSAEISTHDRDFDKRFFLDTDSVDFTCEFFSNPEKRKAVHEIFNKGFNRLVHDGRYMYAMLSPARHRQILEKEDVEETVTNLIILSKNLPTAAARKTRTKSNRKTKPYILLAVVLSVLLITAFTTMILGFLDYKTLKPFALFLDSLKFSLPLMLVLLFLVLRGGRPWSSRELLKIILVSLFIFILSGFGIELYLNGALDREESHIYTVRVIDKYEDETENSYNYYAVVEPWRYGEDKKAFRISKSIFSRLEPGKAKMRIFIKPGKFNFPWLMEYQLVRQRGE
ncbi:MAG: hypothetical protein PVH61_08495 [Candidatus Aminicenantes bacterium]|jgi:hypothetical protein